MKVLMHSERFNKSTREDFEKQNLEKHKDKLTAFYLTNGDQRYIYDPSPEFSGIEITPDYRNAVVENMRNGVDYSGIERSLLENLAGPEYFNGPDGVFNSLSGDKHQKRILTYMTGEEWDKYNETNGDNVSAFLRAYPTPMDFERDSEDFLQMIEDVNGGEKGQEYREAMEEFKNNVYGKKYEYYKAMQDFHREAGDQKEHQSKTINITEITDQSAGAPDVSSQELANPAYEVESKPKDYTEIDRNEAINLLRYTRLEGDPISFSERPAEGISIEKLLNNELEPRFQFQLEGVNFNTSRVFKLGRKDAVLCYVNTPDGKVSARSYYRSGSQGVWRYLPDYKLGEQGNVEWYGKGTDEHQLTLPIGVQKVLNEIQEQSYDERPDQSNLTIETMECFFGTAKRIDSTYDYLAKRWNGRSGDALDTEVNNHPSIEYLGDLDKLPPEAMSIDSNLAPNFDDQTDEFDMQSAVYNAKIRSFKSNNGELTWSFIEDSTGKVCIGSIEVNSKKITSTGLREEWVKPGSLATPLYEYSRQDHGLGDNNDRRLSYVGMWGNCLSRMPIIQAYLARNNGGNR